jgi:hypothetical protein
MILEGGITLWMLFWDFDVLHVKSLCCLTSISQLMQLVRMLPNKVT